MESCSFPPETLLVLFLAFFHFKDSNKAFGPTQFGNGSRATTALLRAQKIISFLGDSKGSSNTIVLAFPTQCPT
jgi:hypothetical protein